MKQVRITWKSETTGFQSHGEWFEDTTPNMEALRAICSEMNKKYKQEKINHSLEYKDTDLTLQ